MRADFVFENYLLGSDTDEQVEQYGLNANDVEEAITFGVMKYIEMRKIEDTLRSEHALGSAQAA